MSRTYEEAALDLLTYMPEGNAVVRANALVEIRAMLVKECAHARRD